MQSTTLPKNGYTHAENKNSPLNPGKKSSYKYWLKRHMLFSKFDLGILLDEGISIAIIYLVSLHVLLFFYLFHRKLVFSLSRNLKLPYC